MKQSERLVALVARLYDELTDEEQKVLAQALQTAQRLELGEGFSIKSVVSQSSGAPRVEACWMGMLAQLTCDQARSIAAGIYDAASEAEADAALVAFLQKELNFDLMQAAGALHLVRQQRDQLREPVTAEKQEPSSVAHMPTQGGKPS